MKSIQIHNLPCCDMPILQGKFVNGEQIYIEVPDGMEEFYGSKEDMALLLNARNL